MASSPATSTQNRLTFTGYAEPDAYITLYDGNDMVGLAVADANGFWRVTSDKLDDGLHVLSATATDVAGNVSEHSPTSYVNIKASADATPKAPIETPHEAQLGFNTDTGASGTDHLTKVSLPVYVGQAKPGSFIELVIDGVKGKFGVPVDANGNWEARGENLSEGAHTISVIEHDSDGNTSAASEPMALILDTSAPQKPDVPVLVPHIDDISVEGKTITHDTTPEFTGIAEAGARVDLYDWSYFGTTKIGSTVADSNGAWSITAGTLADSQHTVSIMVTDLAGNSVDSEKFIFSIDTNAPRLSSPSDTGIVGDGMTNQANPTVYGNAARGTSVVLYEGTEVVGTTVATGDGFWRITTTKALSDGQHILYAKATDNAGNVLPTTGNLLVTVDTQGPQTVSTAPVLDAADDHGGSASDQVTNTGTVTVRGITEADTRATVRVYVDGVEQYLKSGVGANGAWGSILYGLSDGVHRVSVTTTDQAGNVGPRSAESIITVDTKAPDAPASIKFDAQPGATPRVSGKAEAGATINLYDGAIHIGSTVADDKGAWSIVSQFADGKHSLTVTASDLAGNTSKPSAALNLTTDATPEAAPTALDLLTASDKGASSTDNLSNLPTPTVTGKAAAGVTVLLFDGATQVGKAVANAAGAWSITSGKLPDGVHHLTAVTQDAAGNLSAPSAELLVSIDTALPEVGAPVLDALADSGRSQADGITNSTAPHLAGTAEAGATVTLYDGATLVGTVIADDHGAWSINLKTLASGAHSITAKATDAAGNVSKASAALAITIDTKGPGAPTALDLAASHDSGTSNSDNLTAIATPTVAGKAEANAIVTVYDGVTLLGSTTADNSGKWSFTASAPLADGVHSLTATATDVAGNLSSASAALKLTIDTATAAPIALDLAAASDKGASASDNITNLSAPVITGKAEAGATVVLYDGVTQIGKATANTSGVWSITSAKLADAEHHLTALATDAAGNLSQASAELALTIDTKAVLPTKAPLLDAQSDSGRSHSDGITNIGTPKVSGVTEVGASVALYDGNTLVGSTLADSDGAWSITSKALAAGAHKLTVKVTDIAGNVSAASPVLALTVDLKAPAAPAALDLPASYDTGVAATDNQTAISTPVISGKAEALAVVALYDGGTLLGSTIADSGGAWKIASTVSLAAGAHSLTATATDVAGNVSGASAAFKLTIDPAATGLALAGTGAADSFLLNAQAGAIKVSGFSVGGGDHLLLAHDFNGLSLGSAADVLALGHVDGKNFVIDLGAGHEVTLVGVTSLAEAAITLL
jgi:hypothetical protein